MRKIIAGNWTVTTGLLLSLPCMVVASGDAKASPKASPKSAPPVISSPNKPWSASESDLRGDWYTGDAEGWRIRLSPDHVAAIYEEGVIESKPSFSTWKLIKDRVIISGGAALGMGSVEGRSDELIAMRTRNRIVLLPAGNLPLVERYGLAAFLCFWHVGPKGLGELPHDYAKIDKSVLELIEKDIEKNKRKHE